MLTRCLESMHVIVRRDGAIRGAFKVWIGVDAVVSRLMQQHYRSLSIARYSLASPRLHALTRLSVLPMQCSHVCL